MLGRIADLLLLRTPAVARRPGPVTPVRLATAAVSAAVIPAVALSATYVATASHVHALRAAAAVLIYVPCSALAFVAAFSLVVHKVARAAHTSVSLADAAAVSAAIVLPAWLGTLLWVPVVAAGLPYFLGVLVWAIAAAAVAMPALGRSVTAALGVRRRWRPVFARGARIGFAVVFASTAVVFAVVAHGVLDAVDPLGMFVSGVRPLPPVPTPTW